MIEFNFLILNSELDRASENLPSETHVIGYVKNEENIEYSFFFIGRDESDNIKEQDIIYFRDGDETDYILRDYGIQYFSIDYVDSFTIFLDKIPDYLQYIDLYLNNDKDDSILSECILRFESKCDLFCYRFVTEQEHKNLFLGTFARVTDGWKFYPKFLEHSIEMEEILIIRQ